MTERKGPFVTFPHGQYKGTCIDNIIRKDPHFFMVQVKRWMNVSPSQATLFSSTYDGAEIPEEFIVEADTSTKSFDQVLDEEYVDIDNKCWRRKKDNSIISTF